MDMSLGLMGESFFHDEIAKVSESIGQFNDNSQEPDIEKLFLALERLNSRYAVDKSLWASVLVRLLNISSRMKIGSHVREIILQLQDQDEFKLDFNPEVHNAIRYFLKSSEFELCRQILSLCRDDKASNSIQVQLKVKSLVGIGQYERAMDEIIKSNPDGVRRYRAQPNREVIPTPKTIHQFWNTSYPPEVISTRMKKWAEINPSWVHATYDLNSASEVVFAVGGKRSLMAFESLTVAAAQADIFRLAVLIHSGGVYIDADDEATVPLSLTIDKTYGLVVIEKKLWHIQNSFIASPAGSQLLHTIFDHAINNIEKRSRKSISSICGPGLFSAVFKKHLERGEFDTAPIHIYSREYGYMFRQLSNYGDRGQIAHWSTIDPMDYYFARGH
jgi:mannosyltransferase OCH1-like enzyme